MAATKLTQALAPGTRVLLVVNSAAAQGTEIDRAFQAVVAAAGVDGLSVIAPSAMRRWFIHHGVAARRILLPRVAGLEIEFRDFLQRPTAVRWALECQADVLLGTEPYAPRNEEVKTDFERAMAPLLGRGRYLVHSLPAGEAFLLPAEELWRRAARGAAVLQHQARLGVALDQLHTQWRTPGEPAHGDLQAVLTTLGRPEPSADDAAVVTARQFAFDQLGAALLLPSTRAHTPRLLVDPPSAAPAGGWLPARVEAVTRPAQLSDRIKFHGTRLVTRGLAEGPYSYLVMSRPVVLAAGDAVLAEGRVYRGGVTIGLVKGDGWASKVDIDEPGSFLAAAVATEAGPHTLVVANCLKGDERQVAVALRRFGWARAR